MLSCPAVPAPNTAPSSRQTFGSRFFSPFSPSRKKSPHPAEPDLRFFLRAKPRRAALLFFPFSDPGISKETKPSTLPLLVFSSSTKPFQLRTQSTNPHLPHSPAQAQTLLPGRLRTLSRKKQPQDLLLGSTSIHNPRPPAVLCYSPSLSTSSPTIASKIPVFSGSRRSHCSLPLIFLFSSFSPSSSPSPSVAALSSKPLVTLHPSRIVCYSADLPESFPCSASRNSRLLLQEPSRAPQEALLL